jgi:excisionase family DNA binding protein
MPQAMKIPTIDEANAQLAELERLTGITRDPKPSAIATPPAIEPMLTRAEVCELVRVRPETLCRWMKTGQGPKPVKLGRLVRYRRSEVDRYLASLGGE